MSGEPKLPEWATRDEVLAQLRTELAATGECPTCQRKAATPAPRDPHPASRRDDPDTSRRGARNAAGRVGSQRRRLLDAYALGFDMTPDEAMSTARLSPLSCYWKRVSELGQAGLIELTGAERPGDSGSDQRVYRITAAGRRATA